MTSSRTEPYSVSRLNLEAQGLLEGSFPLIWLQGEISNLARPRSGHIYFSLKDDRAQVNAAMFRNRNSLLRFQPRDGQQILVRARVTVFVPRGGFQIIVEHMEEAGEGALRAQFEALKAKLESEGLFAQERKRPLPAWPRRIGVITSPSGAAIRDVLQVLKRRAPSIP
ncbi:MAG: exodeoxyribonuclease VII large subunit, partial [Pseudomonadota bacterium]|nr:exodeoxyribonuclease VII large subunit [Pseudomonadota bacterium]